MKTETESVNSAKLFFLGFIHAGDYGLPPGVKATHTPAEVCPYHCDQWNLEHPIRVDRGGATRPKA